MGVILSGGQRTPFGSRFSSTLWSWLRQDLSFLLLCALRQLFCPRLPAHHGNAEIHRAHHHVWLVTWVPVRTVMLKHPALLPGATPSVLTQSSFPVSQAHVSPQRPANGNPAGLLLPSLVREPGHSMQGGMAGQQRRGRAGRRTLRSFTS